MVVASASPNPTEEGGIGSIKWRCTLCGERCKTYVPLVLAEDVKCIQECLNRSMSTFVSFYHPTDFCSPLDESYQGYLFRTKHGLLAMCLSRTVLPDGEVGCVFLKNNSCSIHPLRPFICRQYPFRPAEYNNVEGPFQLMDENLIRQNYRIFEEKQEEYLQKVRQSNEDSLSDTRDTEDFLYFIGLQ